MCGHPVAVVDTYRGLTPGVLETLLLLLVDV